MMLSLLLRRNPILLLLVVNVIIDAPIRFVEPLALLPRPDTQQFSSPEGKTVTIDIKRREILSNLFSTGFLATMATTTTALVLQPDVAQAAIDVSSLRQQVENESASAAINTDIFLGGTYIDTDDNNNANKKYYISLSGTGFAGYRLIKVKGGSSIDDFVELPGMIFTCPAPGPTAAAAATGGGGIGSGSGIQQQQRQRHPIQP
mmetsp:Transcript_16665/g.18651  ORF Transcript_16665/g.18651 Transcript_16665/m.18651 type:complete len:204 (-) Transcript_16665:210-821(-)